MTEHTVKRLRHIIRWWPDTGDPIHSNSTKLVPRVKSKQGLSGVLCVPCTPKFMLKGEWHNTGLAEA